MDTASFAQQMVEAIEFCKKAHIDKPNTLLDSVRFFDKQTPYINHPIWAASTILTETSLSETLRVEGYLALILHDVLEDTKLKLPNTLQESVRLLVQQMSFSSFKEEQQQLFNCTPIIRLLKCYDKVSNLLDASWMKREKWDNYCNFTQRLIVDVEANYGQLNIVKIGKAIAVPH